MRLRTYFRKAALVAIAVLACALPGIAANTIFFTSIGDVTFPFSPPTSGGSNPGAIDNMVIGATTPKNATFANVTVNGTLSGAGVSGQLAAPGPIGSTTPNTGAFTTLTASGATTFSPASAAVTLSPTGSGTVVINPATASTIDNEAIGGTTPLAGTFTALTATGQLRTTFGTPTIGSGNCGSGSNGSVSGNNQAGLIAIGSSATTSCQVSFSTTLANAPNACVLFPANATAAATGTTVARVSAISTSGFTVTGAVLASANYYFLCV